MESGLSELGFWRLTAESRSNALDSRQSPFVESEERPAPHVDFLAPIRLATRAWVAEKRDYRSKSIEAQLNTTVGVGACLEAANITGYRQPSAM